MTRLKPRRPAQLHMVVCAENKAEFTVIVRLGCIAPKEYNGVENFWQKNLPYKEEHYPSLASYWKIRLLK